MNGQNLQNEFRRLLNSDREEDKIDSYNNVVDSAFFVFNSYRELQWNEMDSDAETLFQMTILKCLSLKKLISGVNYESNLSELRFNGLRDVFSMWTIVRAQFEATCNFFNIYLGTTSDDQKLLWYNLWVISGLKYRQRSHGIIISEEGRAQLENERVIINNLIDDIHENPFYTSLTAENKIRIDRFITKREYQIVIQNSRVQKAGWKDLVMNMGINDSFDELYSFLSLSTHPSNISVLQFKELYSHGNSQRMSLIAIHISKLLIAFLTRDFLTYVSELRPSFEELPEINQMIINSINRTYRSPGYVLNNLNENLA